MNDFNRGVWFAVDFLVRWVDDPTSAMEICKAASIGRSIARELWNDSELNDVYRSDLMEAFLNGEDWYN